MLMSLILPVVLAALLYYWFIGRRANLPPGPMPLPFIGNLHQLGTDFAKLPDVLSEFGRQYGGIFTIWMPGAHVVITDYELLKEALVQHGDCFSGRVNQYLMTAFAKGKNGIINADGWLWQEQRRFALRVLRDFGFGRNIMEMKINTDLDRLVEFLTEAANSNQEIDLDESFKSSIASIIGNLTFSHRYELQNDPMLSRLDALTLELQTTFASPITQLLNACPSLRFVPLFDNFNMNKLDRLIAEFTKFYQDQIDEHRLMLAESPHAEAEDFTCAFLQEMKKRKDTGQSMDSFTDWQLMCAVADIWSAGIDTTASSLRWGILFLCLNPQVQERAFEELKEQFPELQHHQMTMGDRSKLPYLMACLHEMQRCANVIPVNMQHCVTDDVTIGGVHIPKDTPILPQIGSVLRNEKFFPEPTKFNPQRLLIKSDDGKMALDPQLMEKVIPFSMGKRQCLGESLARMELFLFFSTFIQKFKFRLAPDDARRSEQDLLKPKAGFASFPAKYKVVIETRH